jgi:hypothetical protein
MENNMLDFTYSMVLRRPWLWGRKVYGDGGTNLTTIEGNDIVRTIAITKVVKVVLYYNFL